MVCVTESARILTELRAKKRGFIDLQIIFVQLFSTSFKYSLNLELKH
jgi:hypothetical protein